MYQYYNPNPIANRTDDCVVRAIAAAFNVSWDDAFDAVAANAKAMGEVMQSDHAWGALLRQFGFEKDLLPDTCPDCYTVGDFADDHPHGVYVVKTDGHVVTVVDGTVYDSFDSTGETPIYYWRRERNKRRANHV